MPISKYKIAGLLEQASKSTIERIGVFADYLDNQKEAYKYNEDTYSSIFGQELMKLLDNNEYSRAIVINQMPVYKEDKTSAGITDISVYFNYEGEDYEIILEAKYWRDPEEESWDISSGDSSEFQLKKYFDSDDYLESPFSQLKRYMRCCDPYINRIVAEHRFGVVLIYHRINDKIDAKGYFEKIENDNNAIFYFVKPDVNFCIYGEVYAFGELTT